MNYQVLARKWRPRTFAEVAGQQPILQALHNALTAGTVHHAYLFTGTRGVGKTTIARIVAKCLNCEQGITATPCGSCAACIDIDAGRYMDVIEVDAASRTKVEDTRALLENVAYAPTSGRFKVYIIDEVHMLSNHSFNALLKTLEEPPAHVKFLLATTEPKKLPITILSRCLQFQLRNFTAEQISSHLSTVLHAENISYEEAALHKLSLVADGSMRDALTLLEQVIALSRGGASTGHITTSIVLQMLGVASDKLILELLEAIVAIDNERAFAVIQELALQAVDFKKILFELQALLHKIAVGQALPSYLELPENTSSIDVNAALKLLISKVSPQDVQIFYQIAANGQRDLPYAPSLRLGFEMIVLRMLCFQPLKLSPKLGSSTIVPASPVVHRSPVTTVAQTAPTSKPPLVAPKAQQRPAKWNDILSRLNLSGMVKVIAENCELKRWDDKTIELVLHYNYRHLLKDQQKKQLQDILQQQFGADLNVVITLGESELRVNDEPNVAASSGNGARVVASNIDELHVKKMQQLLQAEVEEVIPVK